MELYRKFDGYNRNCLILSYSEVNKTISNGTFSKAIWELKGFGFIDVVRPGRLEKNNTIYALTNRWKGLSSKPNKLNKIVKLLKRIEKAKRIKIPEQLSELEKTKFRLKRKGLTNKIRYQIEKAA